MCLPMATIAIYISHSKVVLYVSTSLSPPYTPAICLVVKEEVISNTNLKELPKTRGVILARQTIGVCLPTFVFQQAQIHYVYQPPTTEYTLTFTSSSISLCSYF